MGRGSGRSRGTSLGVAEEVSEAIRVEATVAEPEVTEVTRWAEEETSEEYLGATGEVHITEAEISMTEVIRWARAK